MAIDKKAYAIGFEAGWKAAAYHLLGPEPKAFDDDDLNMGAVIHEMTDDY